MLFPLFQFRHCLGYIRLVFRVTHSDYFTIKRLHLYGTAGKKCPIGEKKLSQVYLCERSSERPSTPSKKRLTRDGWRIKHLEPFNKKVLMYLRCLRYIGKARHSHIFFATNFPCLNLELAVVKPLIAHSYKT